jgi:hypothetical protein
MIRTISKCVEESPKPQVVGLINLVGHDHGTICSRHSTIRAKQFGYERQFLTYENIYKLSTNSLNSEFRNY